MESFLKREGGAIDFEKRKKTRSFLYFNNEFQLMGYFSLCVKNFIFSEDVIKSLRRNIDGFNANSESAVVYLIGQLGRDNRYSLKGFGAELLKDAVDCLLEVQNYVGGRYCLIETEKTNTNQKVIDFYRRNGFTDLQEDNKDDITYLQLVAKL